MLVSTACPKLGMGKAYNEVVAPVATNLLSFCSTDEWHDSHEKAGWLNQWKQNLRNETVHKKQRRQSLLETIILEISASALLRLPQHLWTNAGRSLHRYVQSCSQKSQFLLRIAIFPLPAAHAPSSLTVHRIPDFSNELSILYSKEICP